jgi:eukaryotic-like serine/threonine-protein kinase
VTPERWQQVRGVFKSALEREASERSAFLDGACAGDESLRREVESLLDSLAQGQSFLETPAYQIVAEPRPGTPPELEAGQTLGGYEVLRRIGAGGMGEVYLARDTKLGRQVALKLLPAGFTDDEERLRRFEQEARAASALNHPNIVTIHEIRRAGSTHFIATEFIDGVTLRDQMSSRTFKLAELLEVATQIASALSAAHTTGVIHRDIKPENVMLRSDRIVKVLDFGLAKLMSREVTEVDAEASTKSIVKTTPGLVMGTVKYMSPEQARGQDVDARTDLWSLGVVVYEMVAGRPPFEGETSSHVIVSILESDPPPLARFTRVPAELERIVGKALRKDREERYQTASDLALDLKSLKQDLEVENRLKRSLQSLPGYRETITKSNGNVSPETLQRSAANTGDVIKGRATSNAEYLVGAVKRHKRTAVLTAIALLVSVAAGIYFFYPAPGGETINSLAVLPFINANGDPDTEYISDGISDNIINSLSRLPNMNVISLNAVMRYKGRQIDPQEIGRELNVRAVLVGRLVQRGDNLTISTELVDVRDNHRLWGDQYNRKLSDILTLQDEIAREISERLELRLTGQEKELLTKHYTENTEAYELYLKGRYFFDKRTVEGVRQSKVYFQEAIKKDPNYALAYTGLANACTPSDLLLPPRESMAEAKAAARNALKIDDSLAQAHTAQSRVLLFYDWDWQGAETELKRAIELNPNYAEAHHMYSHYLVNVGQTQQSLAESRRALEIDPHDVLLNVHLGWNYLYARQSDQAIEQMRKAIEMDPDFFRAHLFLGRAYEQKGMYKEALAAYERAIELEAKRGETVVMLGHLHAVSGNRAEATSILEELRELYRGNKISAYDLAVIYAGLGENEQAFEFLRKSYEERTGGLLLLKSEPIFESLRSDPRYGELLRRMGLTSL